MALARSNSFDWESRRKPLNARGRRLGFRAQAQVERMPLVEVAEPGLACAAGEQRHDNGREEDRKILLK